MPLIQNGTYLLSLTTAVTEEALATPTSCIITYHPPIFKPLTSLTLSKPLQANLLRCAASNISVYCPHTSLDSVNGGINDWLTSAFGEKDRGEISVRYIGEELEGGIGGQARLVTLPNPISMKEVERKIKKLLKLEQIQVAYLPGQDPSAQTVRSIGICAGSGGDMLLGAAADVYFTGEMAHHDVLAAVASGHNVVLCASSQQKKLFTLLTMTPRLMFSSSPE
ncbi:hypothetical protein EW026_g512 [Hermanssonia centrifuga]|uniref:NIF3-like protein 1 n=1 Tax=Hermanssonia centrifuga TaxID=98765 RepID=A0A4S4KYY1_9APHY|nr:hypothetical protein EW026_g512 [Hermanssonia centrifuga]